MYFESLSEIINMAGHGVFVWASYAISLVVITSLIVQPVRHYRKQLLRLRRQSEV